MPEKSASFRVISVLIYPLIYPKLPVGGNSPLSARSAIEFTRCATEALTDGMTAAKPGVFEGARVLRLRLYPLDKQDHATQCDSDVHEDVWWRGAIEDREFGPDEIGVLRIAHTITIRAT